MPTYWVQVGHRIGHYIEANKPEQAKMLAIGKYREQYPLRAKLRDPAKSCFVRLVDINPIAVSEARIVRHYE